MLSVWNRLHTPKDVFHSTCEMFENPSAFMSNF